MSFHPNWVSLPSATITNIMAEKGISINKFSVLLGWKTEQVEKLILGELLINDEIAGKLHLILGASKEFWLRRQNIYNIRNKEIEERKENWLNSLPLKDMIKCGWINKTKNLFYECLSFFNVPDIEEWEEKYGNVLYSTSFRKSPTYDSEKYAISAWIRRAEMMTNDFHCKEWNKDLFEKKLLTEIKTLTRIKKPEVFIPKLTEICAECGVLLAIVPSISKCYTSGATKFLSPQKALMILSFRYLSDDHFWFTFFHEAGHLILHKNNTIRIDKQNIHSCDVNEEEKEANLFSAECLIPYGMKDEFFRMKRTTRNIINFANRANISPGILIGQFQFNKLIKFESLNSYKRKYSWDEINLGIEKAIQNLTNLN